MESRHKKHTLIIAILAAVVTVAVLMVLLRLPGMMENQKNTLVIAEEKGVYDLRGVADFEKTTLLLLPGDTYYPAALLTPETLDLAAPVSRDEFAAHPVDYLSQHFVILLPDNRDIYALTLKWSGRHGVRVYINGEFAVQGGQPGTTRQDAEVWENNITFHGTAIDGKMDILFQAAQFYHAKRSASLASLYLSSNDTGPDPFFFGRMKGLAVMGVLLCAAVLLMSIYLSLSHTRATLYFAIACMVMALRECLQSQAWIYFSMGGNLSTMLEYLSVALLTIFLTLYLAQYAAGKFLQIVKCTAVLGSALYGACVLFGSSLFYTGILGYYQFLLVICIVPGIAVLFYQMRNPSKEQGTAIFGIAVFYLAALSDIIMYSDIFGGGASIPAVETAMLVFMLAQTVSLFQMNNRVLSEVKAAEQKLEAENIALESLNQLKTEFLGNVSHELKTPLTVMSGYAQTTKQLARQSGSLDADSVSHRMTLISSEAERLSLMVGQILDVTRMEEGRMIMEPMRCYVDEIVHTAVETHYPILNKNKNRLDIHIESGLPAVYADPARISQVIVNLISNAVRFTSEGVITISAKKEKNGILICVSDAGIGISAERLPHVFERYNKKQKTGGGQDTGTGLGLYICKHIVEQHGGEIRIESIAGKGTSVFFILPLR